MGLIIVRPSIAAALACCFILSVSLEPAQAGSISAAKATPASFFGVMADGPAIDGSTDAAAEFRLMRSSGARSVRFSIFWRSVESSRGAFDFAKLDVLVGGAANAGVTVLPVVQGTPAWAASAPATYASPPADPSDYAAFVAKLARRYGPSGEFWKTNKGKDLPIKSWQIWNEPNLDGSWSLEQGPWVQGYVSLLRSTRKALKAVDPTAKIVLGGLCSSRKGASWENLRAIYAAGGRGLFDIAAVHPFSQRVASIVKIVDFSRAVMRDYKDTKTPMLLTEISWSSAVGWPVDPAYGWELTEQGQATQLRATLTALAARRQVDNIVGFHWAGWLSPAVGSTNSFDYSGLRKMVGAIPVSKPALSAYRETVSKLTR